MRISNYTYTKNDALYICFCQNTDVPQTALKYLMKRQKHLKKYPGYYNDLYNYDFKQLEGIQNGIPIFEKLSFKQLAFFFKHATEILLKRGCHNMCTHCYAKAMPSSYIEKAGQIHSIDFEDFENFCNGINTLNSRMGFNVFKKSFISYNTLFHDADSSMITLTDKNGKIYDYADLAKMLHNVTGKNVVFDTSGWNIQDTKTQARMEALVKKVMGTDIYDFIKFNVSINPFHSIYNLALKYAKTGNIEKAQKYRDIYTDRLANVIYTLAPIRNKCNSQEGIQGLNFIIRSLPDNYGYDGQDEKALSELLNIVCDKLKKIHESKFSKLTKMVVKNEDIHWIVNQLLPKKIDIIAAVGRATNIITDKNSYIYKKTLDYQYWSAKKGSKRFKNGILDINGNFYITNWARTYPTNITLNYSNKGKPTASIHPNLSDDIITEDLM